MAKNDPKCNADILSAAFIALRSEDFMTQNEGVAAAIQIGRAAVPGLLSLLEDRGVNRAQVMYALAQIGDSGAEQAFLAELGDGDERVRAYAAQGLVGIGHPDAMQACLHTLNDAADELHLDRTPSVDALGRMGLESVPFLLDLLMNEEEMTRLHSHRALELVVMRCHGFRSGQGFPTADAEEQARAAWQDNGNYDYAADETIRAAAVTRLRVWFGTFTE